MAEAIIDLSNYRDRSGSRVPEGDYLVQVDDIEMGESKAGNEMWTVYLKIVGGDHDGLNLVDRLTMSEKALFRVVGFLQGLGIKTPRKRLKLDTNRMVGRKVIAQVADGEPYRGTVRSEVKGYQRYSAPASASADIEDLEGDDEETVKTEPEETAEETPAPKKAEKSKPKEEPQPEQDDDNDDEGNGTSDDAELDLDELDV